MLYTDALSFNNSLFAKATLHCVRITKESALKCDAKSFKVGLMAFGSNLEIALYQQTTRFDIKFYFKRFFML